jgi:hypothetical protein
MGKDDLEPAGLGDAPTQPIFTALAAVLAAIEAGTIEQAAVDWNVTNPDDSATSLAITIYKRAQPPFGRVTVKTDVDPDEDDPPTPKE